MAEDEKDANDRSAHAKVERGSVHARQGRITRLRSRLTAVGIATATVGTLWGFYTSDGLQSKVCTLPLVQPFLSDSCGALGFGGRPSRAERLAWQDVTGRPGDCAALSAHIAKYPQGAYRQQARDLLEARHFSAQEPWLASQSTIDIYQPRETHALTSEAAARRTAIASANGLAERECGKQSIVLHARFLSANATPEDWSCDQIGGGVVCGFRGRATCQIETPVELCGAAR